MGNDRADLARQLLVAWRWFDDGLRHSLREAGFGEITTAQSMLFPFLDPDGTRPSELAERAGATRQGVHQLLNGLIDKGYVELVPDPTDGRSKLVRLTAHGQNSVIAAQRSLEMLEGQVRNRLGAKQTDELRNLLRQGWPTEDRGPLDIADRH